jgi:hypothetical protein
MLDVESSFKQKPHKKLPRNVTEPFLLSGQIKTD